MGCPMSRRFCETSELRTHRISKFPGLATAVRPGAPRSRLLSTGAQLAHRVGQLANLTLTEIALLLRSLALRSLAHSTFVGEPVGHEPREIAHDEHDPEDFDVHPSSPSELRYCA